MVYRVLRTPGGIEVIAEEDDWAVEDGYRLAMLGPHDADVEAMWEQFHSSAIRSFSIGRTRG